MATKQSSIKYLDESTTIHQQEFWNTPSGTRSQKYIWVSPQPPANKGFGTPRQGRDRKNISG